MTKDLSSSAMRRVEIFPVFFPNLKPKLCWHKTDRKNYDCGDSVAKRLISNHLPSPPTHLSYHTSPSRFSFFLIGPFKKTLDFIFVISYSAPAFGIVTVAYPRGSQLFVSLVQKIRWSLPTFIYLSDCQNNSFARIYCF